MFAEGTANWPVDYSDVAHAIRNRGYTATDIQLSFDEFQQIWRFDADIELITDTQLTGE